MRVLALTDRDQRLSRMMASRLREAGATVVLAGPGKPRDGEWVHPPQGPLSKPFASGAFGQVDAVVILECGGHIMCPLDLAALPVPTLLYAVDTHVRYREHLSIAKLCDATCLVQKQYTLAFCNDGVRAHWIPLAANPKAHFPVPGNPTHDFVFVGNVNPRLHVNRSHLLQRLQTRYSVLVTRAAYADIPKVATQGKIAFNCSLAGELNLRVFEMLASGRCLLTDRAPGSGLEELFTDGVHLALFDTDNLEMIADRLLSEPDLIRRIARTGHAEVLERQTWAHRASQLLHVIEGLQVAARPGIQTSIHTHLYLSWRRSHDFASSQLRKPWATR